MNPGIALEKLEEIFTINVLFTSFFSEAISQILIYFVMGWILCPPNPYRS